MHKKIIDFKDGINQTTPDYIKARFSQLELWDTPDYYHTDKFKQVAHQTALLDGVGRRKIEMEETYPVFFYDDEQLAKIFPHDEPIQRTIDFFVQFRETLEDDQKGQINKVINSLQRSLKPAITARDLELKEIVNFFKNSEETYSGTLEDGEKYIANFMTFRDLQQVFGVTSLNDGRDQHIEGVKYKELRKALIEIINNYPELSTYLGTFNLKAAKRFAVENRPKEVRRFFTGEFYHWSTGLKTEQFERIVPIIQLGNTASRPKRDNNQNIIVADALHPQNHTIAADNQFYNDEIGFVLTLRIP